ncbi:MAG TPA: hypothetical protein VJQ06_07410 [Rhizomicrobium sp.]|nr:hypothetical protein [Rhizomicrobium sp.]
MLKDFVIADAVGIQMQGKYIDLHNEFDLMQIRLSPQVHVLELEFAASRPNASPTKFVIQFVEVDWLQISPCALKSGADIVELGYKEPLDNDHDWLMSEEQASPEAHLFLRLSEDEFIRLHAKFAKVIVSS